jgi:toxin ParE1/3/4
MNIEFHPSAEQEFIEAAQYYEARVAGLGRRFIDELEGLKGVLVHRPQIGPHLGGSFRRIVFRRFPFSLIYSIEERKIWVIAVAHQRRRPGYWRTRHDL